MEIHLPEDLQRFVRNQVDSGRFPTEDRVICEALEQFKQAAGTAIPAQPAPDPILGLMRDDAELMDEIVAEAYRRRLWRGPE